MVMVHSNEGEEILGEADGSYAAPRVVYPDGRPSVDSRPPGIDS